MSGVIDDNGQQWERCNGCGEFVRIESLRYEEPSEACPYGRDLCAECCPEQEPHGPAAVIMLHDDGSATAHELDPIDNLKAAGRRALNER